MNICWHPPHAWLHLRSKYDSICSHSHSQKLCFVMLECLVKQFGICPGALTDKLHVFGGQANGDENPGGSYGRPSAGVSHRHSSASFSGPLRRDHCNQTSSDSSRQKQKEVFWDPSEIIAELRLSFNKLQIIMTKNFYEYADLSLFRSLYCCYSVFFGGGVFIWWHAAKGSGCCDKLSALIRRASQEQ